MRRGGSGSKIFFFVLVGLALGYFLISEAVKTIKPPLEVTFATIGGQQEGTKVAIEGILHLPASTSYSPEDRTNRIELLDFDSTEGIDIYIVEVKYGKTFEPNRMASLPTSYETDDFVVWLDDGTSLGDGEAVRVTGWLGIGEGGKAYINPVTKIERAIRAP